MSTSTVVEQSAELIRFCYIKFVADTGFNLKQVCENQKAITGNNFPYSFSTICKWLPSKESSVRPKDSTASEIEESTDKVKKSSSVQPISTKSQLDKLFEIIATCLSVEKYMLIDAHGTEVTTIEDAATIPFCDSTAKKFYYKKLSPIAQATESSTPKVLAEFEAQNAGMYDKYTIYFAPGNTTVQQTILYLVNARNEAYIYLERFNILLTGTYNLANPAGIAVINFRQVKKSILAWQIIFRQFGVDSDCLEGVYSYLDEQNIPACGKLLLVDYENINEKNKEPVQQIADFMLTEANTALHYKDFIITKRVDGQPGEPMLSFSNFMVKLENVGK